MEQSPRDHFVCHYFVVVAVKNEFIMSFSPSPETFSDPQKKNRPQFRKCF